ncbi:syntaxin-1A [Galendromus occidentalis]|uniref:Syntaxin-1A n=1 Tax=Galendromus occidentalis TaxID=34638 RepID=A0AAJ6VXW5_9ACAR|nr:syntaxin-1A [Galendromus occidentalis]
MTKDLILRFQTERQQNEDSPEAQEETEMVTIEIENNNTAMDSFKLKTQQVQECIEQLREDTQQVRDIHARILSSVDSHDKNQELDRSMADVKKLASRIRYTLKEIQSEADKDVKENPTSATSRMKRIQQQTLSKLFVDTMTSYNEAQMEYREKCKYRIKRQLNITGKTPSDEELEDLLESGNFDVFTQGVIMESEKNKQALADVQARHQDIMKLEESVRELRDLFIEMAVLVESQGTMIDRIEYNVANAAEFVDKAKVETKTALDYKHAATKKKFWLIGILIIVILIIFLSIQFG